MDRRRLENLSTEDLLPEPADDRPAVDWGAEPPTVSLWDAYPPRVASEAVRVIREARAVEAETTTDFMRSLPKGVKAHALEFRMKSPSSLARKLRSKVGEDSQEASSKSLQEISGKLTDVLRYTGLCEGHDKLLDTVQATVAGMQARGYQVISAESSYVAGNAYKGIHLLVKKADEARPVEVQFHSELSQGIKDLNHVDYEIERDRANPYAERAAAHFRMLDRWTKGPDPPGLAEFRNVGGCTVESKRYPNPYGESDNGEIGGSKS